MADSKVTIFSLFIALIFSSAWADVSIDTDDQVAGVDSSALKIQLDKLNSMIHALESQIDEKTRVWKSKDEIIAHNDKAIQDKSDAIKSLESEISSLQGKLGAVEQAGKAHARAGELEKQVEKIKKELEAQKSQKETLEARTNVIEKKINELNSKLETVMDCNFFAWHDAAQKMRERSRILLFDMHEEALKLENEILRLNKRIESQLNTNQQMTIQLEERNGYLEERTRLTREMENLVNSRNVSGGWFWWVIQMLCAFVVGGFFCGACKHSSSW